MSTNGYLPFRTLAITRFPCRLLLFIGLMAGAPDALCQEDEASLAEKYRQKMKEDPKNGSRWASCSAAALAKARLSTADFEKYAKRIVTTLKQGDGATLPNPCPELLGPYWGEEGNGATAAAPGRRGARPAAEPDRAPSMPAAGSFSGAGFPAFRDDKTGITKEVSVRLDRIPGFIPGKSIVVPGEVRASHRGLYLLYWPAGSSPETRGVSRIYKLHGRDWMRSEQNALVRSIWISSHPDNESRAALNYYWTGPPAMKESIGSILATNRGTMADTANLGTYNSPGHSFANDNPPAMFWKITGDKDRYNLWGFGDAPPIDVERLGNAHLYRSNDRYGRPEGLQYEQMDVSALFSLDDVIMEGAIRKGDNHIWMAQGTKLHKVRPFGKPFTFTTIHMPAEISKIRLTEEWVWVLAGSDLYRVGRDDKPQKFYRINSGAPSFAVDQNNVYTNDGYILAYDHYTRKSLLGTGSSAFTKAEWAALKSELGSLELEVAPGEQTLYLVNGSGGKVYSIQTF